MASPNVVRAINTAHNRAQDTINRHSSKPFRLRLDASRLLRRKTRPNASVAGTMHAVGLSHDHLAGSILWMSASGAAIAEKRLVEIRYKKAVRLAEPHDYGVIDGTERLLIFQLRGPDSGKGAVGWRLLDLFKIESCASRIRPSPVAVANHTSSITNGMMELVGRERVSPRRSSAPGSSEKSNLPTLHAEVLVGLAKELS